MQNRLQNAILSYKKIPSSVAVFFLFFCLIANADEVKNDSFCGDTIVVASISDAQTLVPILASDSASGDICGLVFNGLVKYDKDINLIGDLAKSWEILEAGLVIVFHLKTGVIWHDGIEFTAADVRFTYEKLIDPDVPTPYSGDFKKVKKFEVLDKYTIRITYEQPFAPALSSWGVWIMPEHLLKNENLVSCKFSRNPVGTGPYKFKRWRSGELIELEVFKEYFEGRAYIDRYIYRIIPDSATMFLELSTENVDYMGLTPLQYLRHTQRSFFKEHFNKFRYPGFGYTYLGYNLADPKFKDKRVREAFNYAVDKNELIKGVLLGLGRVCTGPFPPESWAYNKEVIPVEFNPQKAKELLDDAGWVDTDNDGWLDKNGQIFQFTIITNQGNDQRRMAAEIIQKRLADIGVKVKIKIVEWSVFISEFVDNRRFEAILLGWGLSRDPDCYDIWHSTKTKQGEFNFISYYNPRADELMEKARMTFDQTKRKDDYHQIHKILYEDQPYMFLWVADNLPIVHKRFHNISAAPLGIGYNFIRWYVPITLQKYTR
ncbi:MAG: peptide-binding protein [Candidatus Omnitrophota bacterium]